MIRQLKPATLFVACDGPSAHNQKQVDAVKALIDREIDWNCNINKLYSTKNQGCRLGVSSAINWFFKHVDSGIILEDDCIPSLDFFTFCKSLLVKYEDDFRIWSISGSNFQNGNWRGDGSYYFSRYAHCWGWATWRRAWDQYEGELSSYPMLIKSESAQYLFDDYAERMYWLNKWNEMYSIGSPDSWAYRWGYTCFINSGLSIIPNVNLVRNIGFGKDATHTHGLQTVNNLVGSISSVIHPSFVVRNRDADTFTFNNHYQPHRKNLLAYVVFLVKKSLSILYKIR